jgi:hypothetical protein
MTVKNGNKIAARVGAIASLALGLALIVQPVAGASVTAPSVTVTPSTGLGDTAVVSVKGSGLTAGVVYFVGQCAPVTGGALACNSTRSLQLTATSAGTVSSNITVERTYVGVLADGSAGGTVLCTTNCGIGLSDVGGQTSTGASISFS